MILFGIEYRIERALEKGGSPIVLSPREWVPNPEWPAVNQRVKFGPNFVDFVPRMQQYTKTTEIVITVASASIVFIPQHLSKHPALAMAVILLGFSVVWGVLFIAWMSYCYEQALYSPASYSARESSAMFALGFSGLFCFGFAYLTLAIIVAKAIAAGEVLK